MANIDYRNAVSDPNAAPYSGIAFLASRYAGGDVNGGSGFFIGDRAIATAKHNFANDRSDTSGTIDELLVANGRLSYDAAFVGTHLSVGSASLHYIASSEDTALLITGDPLNSSDPTFQLGSGAAPYVFGLDAFVDLDNFLAYAGQIDASNAGHDGTSIPTSFLQSNGQIDETIVSESGTYFASDVPLVATTARQNGFLLYGISQDGTLDGAGGHSGSPLITFDPETGTYRAMGVYSQGVGILGSIYEVFDADAYDTILSEMYQAGVTQPGYVTNRITGLWNNTSNEFLYGSAYDDVLRGLGASGSASDYLTGGLGNDRYEYEPGFENMLIYEPEADRVDAVADKEDTLVLRGIDTQDVRLVRPRVSDDLYVYVRNPATEFENLIFIDSQFTYSSALEAIAFDDFTLDLTAGLPLVGDDTGQSIDGTGFDDLIYGMGGNDTLHGLAGDDILIGGDGNNSLLGGEDDDIYEFGAVWGRNSVTEENGFDTLRFTEHNFEDVRLIRSIGVNGANLEVLLTDDPGTPEVSEQNVYVWAQFTYDPDRAVEKLVTADGVEIDLFGGLPLTGSDGSDGIQGTPYDDIIGGLGGDDTLRGNGGDDILYGGTGDDVLEGGDGSDTYVFQPGFGFDRVSEWGRYPGQEESGSADTIRLMGINPLSVQQVRDGNNLYINILGLGGSVTDYIYVPGQFYNYATDGLLVEYISFGGAGRVSLGSPEGVFEGSHDADFIPGTVGDDEIRGFGGNDELDGFDGDDQIFAGDGNDLILGGAGNDLFDGGAGVDTVSYDGAQERVVARLNLVEIVSAEQGVDTFVGIENLIGSRFNDRLVGDAADNVLIGGRGDDVLSGLAGNDTLDGGNGDDELTGAGGDDILIGGFGFDRMYGLGGADTFEGGGGNDWIEGGLGVDTVEGGGGADDIFGFFGADTINGGLGDDNIRADGSGDIVDGGAGNDRIVGGNGKDILLGGAGNDIMFGGGGHGNGDGLRDVFVFRATENGGGGFDIIRDFEDTRDKLDLTDLGYASFAALLEDAYDTPFGLEINFHTAGILRLEGFTLADFTAGDAIL